MSETQFEEYEKKTRVIILIIGIGLKLYINKDTEEIYPEILQSKNVKNVTLVNSYIGAVSDLRNQDIEFRSPQYVTQNSYILALGSEEATAAYINRLETYQSNPLWAFYCNNNQGFCIEYDFNNDILFL